MARYPYPLRGFFKTEWHGVPPGTPIHAQGPHWNFLGTARVLTVVRDDGKDLPGPFSPGREAFVAPEFITIVEDEDLRDAFAGTPMPPGLGAYISARRRLGEVEVLTERGWHRFERGAGEWKPVPYTPPPGAPNAR